MASKIWIEVSNETSKHLQDFIKECDIKRADGQYFTLSQVITHIVQDFVESEILNKQLLDEEFHDIQLSSKVETIEIKNKQLLEEDTDD